MRAAAKDTHNEQYHKESNLKKVINSVNTKNSREV